MKKDIAKIPTDLNSRSQEEQLVNFLQKSERKNSFRRFSVNMFIDPARKYSTIHMKIVYLIVS